MDGSMGNELLARRSDLVSGLWSAQYLIDAPELVKEIHLEYIHAGADLIITNTYSTIPSYLSKQKAEDKMSELIHLAGKLAREAVKDSKKKVTHVGILINDKKIIHAFGKIRIDNFSSVGIENTDSKKITHNLIEIRKY